MKRFLALALCLVLCSTFCACGRSKVKGADKTIYFNLSSEPQTLDPQVASDYPSKIVITNLFEGLVRLDENGEPYPGVAEKWEANENNTVFTFTLREDAMWNSKDKTPVTAHDFVYAFQRALDPATGSSTCGDMMCIKNAQEVHSGAMEPGQLGVTAKNDRTLVVELNYEYPDFPALTATAPFMPCNQAFFKEQGGRYGLDTSYLLGNGPFMVDGKYGWEHSQYLNLKRSSYYHGEQTPLPSSVKFSIGSSNADVSDPIAALKNGTVDVIAISGEDVAQAEENGCTILSMQDTTWGLCFNTQNEYMKNPDLRKAFIQSLDRAELLKYLPENTTAADGIIPPETTLEGKTYRTLAGPAYILEQDTAGAANAFQKALLALGIQKIPAVNVLYPEGDQTKLMLDQMLTSWNQQFKQYFNMMPLGKSKLESQVSSGNYTVALCGVRANSDGPSAFLSLFASTSAENPALFKDSQFDSLLTTADNMESGSSQAYLAAENYLGEQAAFYPIYYENSYHALAKGVFGVVVHPYGNGIDFIRAGKE